MYKQYHELSEDLKEIARENNPTNYTEWNYRVQGVEIVYSCK
jgi:hypothetical protein